MFLLLILAFSKPVYGHDIKMAIFEISRQKSGYILEVNLDKDDFEKSLLTTYPVLLQSDDPGLKEHSIREYFYNNFQLHINAQCQEMRVEKITYQEEYVKISIELPHKGTVKEINVFNTCLIDYNPGHMNIFKANLHNKVRTFKLSEERITTTFSYE